MAMGDKLVTLDGLKAVHDYTQEQFGDINSAISDETTRLDSKAPAILETVSGAIANFDDGADSMPVKKLVAQIEPVQDLHGYDHPWPAGGLVNKMPAAPVSSNTVNGITYTSDGNGRYTIKGTASEQVIVDFNFNEVGRLIADNKLSLFNSATGFNLFFRLAGADQAYWNLSAVNRNVTISSSDEKGFDSIRIIVGSGVSVDLSFSPMIYEGDTQTAYSPYSNICPISGWTGAKVTRTGKNLLNWMDDGYVVGGYRVIDLNFLNKQKLYMSITDNDPSVTLPSGTGVGFVTTDWNGDTPLTLNDYRWVYGSNGISSNHSNTATGNEAILCYRLMLWPYSLNDLNTIRQRFNIAVYTEDNVDAYEPYAGQTYDITFPSEAGTVYGGTLTINPDRTGTLVVDTAKIELNGSETSVMISSASATTNVFRVGIPIKFDPSKVQLSTYLKYNREAWSATAVFPYCFVAGTNEAFLQFPVSDIATVQDFRNYLAENNFMCVGTVIEPQAYQLTAEQISGILATIYGTNNIWADTGDVEAEYPADTKLYIQNLTKPTEDDMTANAAITSGKFFMINNRLFLATAAIAAGAMIIPGTNCTELSLADALNNINA